MYGPLVRMSLIASLDKSNACYEGRTAVLRILSRVELVNNLVALLSIDFHNLETDVKKEIALKSKLGAASSSESVLISNLRLVKKLVVKSPKRLSTFTSFSHRS